MAVVRKPFQALLVGEKVWTGYAHAAAERINAGHQRPAERTVPIIWDYTFHSLRDAMADRVDVPLEITSPPSALFVGLSFRIRWFRMR